MTKFLAVLLPYPSLAQTCVSPPLQKIYSLFHWMWVWRSLKHNRKGNEWDSSCTWLPNTQTLKTILCCLLQSSLFEREERMQGTPRNRFFLSITCIYWSCRYSILVERTKSCKLVLIITAHGCSPTFFPDSLQTGDCSLAHCSCFLKSLVLTYYQGS